jgi:pimeloyl-ACP methyl ester carboxylesterase
MTPASSDMQPIAFDRMLGWLHMPLGRNTGVGVVLVSPLGRDGRCAYMPMRLFADRLAAAGFPTVRYDHLGTGDSLDLTQADADALPEWVEGVARAADMLRARAGVTRVVLGGARTGATLAAMCPLQTDGLLLLAPVLNGRSWLRRLEFSARMGSSGDQPHGADQPVDAEGLWLSAATASALARVDLAGLPPPRSPTFIASQNRQVSAYAAALSQAGAAVLATDFPGFGDLFLETTVNLPPFEVFERARTWLLDTFQPTRAARLREPGRQTDQAVLRPPGAVEQVVTFGANLRGVLCEPDPPARDGRAVLFCNTGGDPRAGGGGFASQAARRLATQGLTSLRFDFSGIGDSPMHGDEVRSHVFETSRDQDVDAAVDLLSEHGCKKITIVGTCSGAYHALEAAFRNPKITGVFSVSPIKIVWRPDDSVTFTRDEYLFSLRLYAKAVFRLDAWKFAIRNRVGVTTFLLALVNRLKNRVLGWVTRRIGDSPLARMRRFAARGGRACFVMGVNDTALEEVGTYFGSKGAELRRLPDAKVEIVPGLDHGLTLLASREKAMDLLADWLKERPST